MKDKVRESISLWRPAVDSTEARSPQSDETHWKKHGLSPAEQGQISDRGRRPSYDYDRSIS
jgi:hypothetical protein